MRLFLLPFALASIGCDGRSRDPGRSDAGNLGADAGTGDAGTNGPELIECPAGSALVHFSLAAPAQLPSIAELELTGLPNGAVILPAGDGESYSARFDLCRDGAGAHRLRGLLWVMDTFEAPSYYRLDETVSVATEEIVEYRGGLVFQLRLPPADVVVAGLDAALAGDLQPFEVRVVNDSGLLLLGHAGFIAGARGQVGPSSITYASIYVVAGDLAPGDVFAARRCPFGETPLSAAFRMGSADFAAEACTFLGGGETIGYRIRRFSVTDSSGELTASEQETFTFEGEAAVDAALNYAWNHHNACDSFHLALPHADYAATTAPLAGCGAAVPNAPMRDINEDPGSPVQYRLRYHGGAWTDGTIAGCTHYMFCP